MADAGGAPADGASLRVRALPEDMQGWLHGLRSPYLASVMAWLSFDASRNKGQRLARVKRALDSHHNSFVLLLMLLRSTALPRMRRTISYSRPWHISCRAQMLKAAS